MRRHTLLLVSMAAAVFGAAGDVRAARPNIVVIYADDLGYGDLGCYGAEAIPTPHIDALAAGGLRFTDGYATASTCTPSRYSLLTGEYPFRKKGARILNGDAGMLIGTDQPTIASVLAAAGYRTAVIGKWHLGLGAGRNDWNGAVKPGPLEIGFDTSFIMAATNDRVPCVYVDGHRVAGLDPSDPLDVSYAKENPFPDVPTGRRNPELLTVQQHSDRQHWDTIVNGVGRIGFSRGGAAAQWDDRTMAEVFLERSKAFVSDVGGQPFFLFYALHQPHVPRIPSERFEGSTGLGPRGDVIAELDWCVGELIAHIRGLGLAENTLVVFSSDNGPVLDDGYLDASRDHADVHDAAAGLRGGKYSLFEAGSRVPLIVSWPGTIKPGESDAIVSQVDFLASFAALAGVQSGVGTGADSVDLHRSLVGAEADGRPVVVFEGIGSKQVLREGDWVLIPPYKGAFEWKHKGVELGNMKRPQLYHLADDPEQARNLAAENPSRVQRMTRMLESIRSGGS